MGQNKKEKNRFGYKVETAIPKDVPLAAQPGHKLRTSNTIVDRKALAEKGLIASSGLKDPQTIQKLEGQQIEFVRFEDQVGVIRKTTEGESSSVSAPNSFTGPSYRNPVQKFRFDGHKMLHHLDRVAAWQRGEKFAPIHIDMGLTKFCNTACKATFFGSA